MDGLLPAFAAAMAPNADLRAMGDIVYPSVCSDAAHDTKVSAMPKWRGLGCDHRLSLKAKVI